MLIPLLTAKAGPHHVEKIRNITGIVVDYDRSKGMIVLKDFTDWDRDQMEEAKGWAVSRKEEKLVAWLDQQDKKHAVIWVKKGERGLRKGISIKISGYHYIIDERAVIPEYEKLEIIPKPN